MRKEPEISPTGRHFLGRIDTALALSRRRLLAAGLGALTLSCLPRLARAESDTYVVQDGDTVWDIALALGVDPDDLVALNGLGEGNALQLGQVLKVPARGSDSVAAASASTPATGGLSADGQTYVVRPGDTPWEIAETLGVHIKDLQYLNGLGNITPLEIGRTLLVPPKRPKHVEEPERATISARSGNSDVYIVQPGDTLWDVATALDVDVDSLAATNGVGGSLSVGQELVVPGGSASKLKSAVAQVPYRPQLDGTMYSGSNCGPAALAMLLAYHGDDVSTNTIRRYTNKAMGTTDPDEGVTWEALAYAAKQRGFGTVGLYEGGYRRWRDEDVFGESKIACPILAMMRFRLLPGQENGENGTYIGDHYVVLLGRNARGDAVYHDPAFSTWAGAYRTMTPAQLERAWAQTWAGQVRTGFGLERL